MRLLSPAAWCCGLLVATLTCDKPAPPLQSTSGAGASAANRLRVDSALAFAPFDSVTLEATCRGIVTPAEDTSYRMRVSGLAARPGVLVYAAPARQRRCYQLGVISAEVRDSLAAALRRAGVPDHVVTYFHLTEVPPDDIDQGVAVPRTKAP